MKTNLIPTIGLVFLAGCSASGVRHLSGQELEQHGLRGVMYDVRLCPTEKDKATGQLRVSGECELVTCEPQGTDVACTARPEKAGRRR